MPIPIRNVYYLLCYAWDRLESRDLVDLNAVPGNRTENLLGKALVDGVAQLIRQGLDRGYVALEEDGRRLKGKLLLGETLGRCLLPRGRVACRTDELSHDVAHNQVIKAAMHALTDVPDLDGIIRSGLRDHCQRLQNVSDVPLAPSSFRRVQLHRNIARYGFLINVCQLVARSFIADQETGRLRFRPFTASEQQMGSLFEFFVRNFLKREQDAFEVTSPKVNWDLEPTSSSDPAWLPEMRTDVTLSNSYGRVVIDTKCYATPFQERYDRKKLRSDHLYQLLTYVSQMHATTGLRPLGVLLYARTDEDRRLEYVIGGNHLLVRTLNLDQDWSGIHEDLLGLAQELASL